MLRVAANRDGPGGSASSSESDRKRVDFRFCGLDVVGSSSL